MRLMRVFDTGRGVGMSIIFPGGELLLTNYLSSPVRGRMVVQATLLFDLEGNREVYALPDLDLEWEACEFCGRPDPERLLHERNEDDPDKWFVFRCCSACYEENHGRNGPGNYR